MIRETSERAYNEIKSDGTLARCEEAVLTAIRRAEIPMTIRELSEVLKWAPGSVSGRIRDLVKKDQIEETEKRACCISGKKALTWQVKQRKSWQGELF